MPTISICQPVEKRFQLTKVATLKALPTRRTACLMRRVYVQHLSNLSSHIINGFMEFIYPCYPKRGHWRVVAMTIVFRSDSCVAPSKLLSETHGLQQHQWVKPV